MTDRRDREPRDRRKLSRISSLTSAIQSVVAVGALVVSVVSIVISANTSARSSECDFLYHRYDKVLTMHSAIVDVEGEYRSMIESLKNFATDLPDDAKLLEVKIIDTFVTIHDLLSQLSDQVVRYGYLLPTQYREKWEDLWREMESEYSVLESALGEGRRESLLRLSNITQRMFDHVLGEIPDVVDNAGRELRKSCDSPGRHN